MICINALRSLYTCSQVVINLKVSKMCIIKKLRKNVSHERTDQRYGSDMRFRYHVLASCTCCISVPRPQHHGSPRSNIYISEIAWCTKRLKRMVDDVSQRFDPIFIVIPKGGAECGKETNTHFFFQSPG